MKDGRDALLERLRELDELDPAWALAGNAGGVDHRRLARKITQGDGTEYSSECLPSRAVSLDENFIVLRASSRLGFSRDLAGFHFYGTDICLQARSHGWSAYVINFHLRHEGLGTIDETFLKCRTDIHSHLLQLRY